MIYVQACVRTTTLASLRDLDYQQFELFIQATAANRDFMPVQFVALGAPSNPVAHVLQRTTNSLLLVIANFATQPENVECSGISMTN
jgi:hypothetical protein